MDFSQFRNQDITRIIEDSATISRDLNLREIEPVAVLVALNQHYTDELAHYFNLCGIECNEFYSEVFNTLDLYPHSNQPQRALRVSTSTVNALYIALEIERNVGEMSFPNSALVTGLLMVPGPLKQLADRFGISSSMMQEIVTTSPERVYYDCENERFVTGDRRNDLLQSNVVTEAYPDGPLNCELESESYNIANPVGLTDEISQIDEFILASLKMRDRGVNAKLECDMMLIGPTGTGKSYLAEHFTHKLHDAGLINRREPVIIDAVNWNVIEEKIGETLENIADGVLIIDNAQKLVSENDANNIGSLDSLFSAMSFMDRRPIVILAGLPGGMDEFIAKNPSVARKFEYIFHLKEYSAEELTKICEATLTQKFNENLDEPCRLRLTNIFKHLLRNKPSNWAGAHSAVRKADNIFMAFNMHGNQRISLEDIAGVEERDVTIEEVLAKLDDFVGVDNIREELRQMASEIECDRERFGGQPSIRSHFVFTGNPGTGKTTVARIFADALKALKVLPSGHLIEADRSKLVSGYVGQTAIQTNEVIDQALGGVLFIDEAYTLVSDINSGSGFGKEAVDTLLKRLEDDRGKFVCIVAGYTKEMHDFLQSNPGMQSRFNKVIEFNDYTGSELAEIFRRIVANNRFALSDDASENIDNFFKGLYAGRSRNFGNAREVRNIFDEAKKRQSRRLATMRDHGNYSPDMAFTLTREDIEGEESLRTMTIEDVISEMDRDFIGMESVKTAIRNLATTISANMRRTMAGVGDNNKLGVHLLLTGNPGTGKTTVARTLGKVFKAIKLLPTNKVIEADKNAMVGQYVGSTPQKVNDIVDRAMGGVLFIDEAYTLSEDSSGNSFGKEAIETLMKRMEDDRGKFVCIMAGYRDLMEEFVRVNPGIDSRISHRIHIEDYSAEELTKIYLRMAENQQMSVEPDAVGKLKRAIDNMVIVKTKDFGNARDIRKLLDKTLEQQSVRIQSLPDSISPNELSLIKTEDIPVEVHKEIDERQSLQKLDALVGLYGVKREIRNITQYLKLEKMRAEALGKRFVGLRDHYLFLGNPGTGKTTVARILGEIFLSLGISKNTRFVETDRAGLVAGYVGQTASQTNRVIDSAMGGILFIDEAYTLSQGFNDSFGQEAIDTLLKRMEDDRGKFVCIAAGYSHEMQQFITSNSGLQSRFNKVIYFEDYSEEELVGIFKRKILSDGLTLATNAESAMENMVSTIFGRRNANFGNAREINNLFQRVKEQQSNRLYQLMASGITPSNNALLTLDPADFLIL